MKELKDIDFKNSPFLKAHMDEQVKQWYEQQKQAAAEEIRPFIILAITLVVLAVWMYFDPLAFRFLFQGY